MTFTPTLAAALALVLAVAPARTQNPPPAANPLIQAGHRDGRAAAGAESVAGYATLGVVTGLLAGAVGLPLIFAGDQTGAKVLGVATLVPVIATGTAGSVSRPSPPPHVAQRIQAEPPAYQDAFRSSYATRLAERRGRAAGVGGLVGTLVGIVAFTALIFAAFATEGT